MEVLFLGFASSLSLVRNYVENISIITKLFIRKSKLSLLNDLKRRRNIGRTDLLYPIVAFDA